MDIPANSSPTLAPIADSKGYAVHNLDGDCCPAVVDPAVFYGTLLFLALGTSYIVSLLAFSTITNAINQIIAIIQGILGRRRRKRRRRRGSNPLFSTLRFSSAAMLGGY